MELNFWTLQIVNKIDKMIIFSQKNKRKIYYYVPLNFQWIVFASGLFRLQIGGKKGVVFVRWFVMNTSYVVRLIQSNLVFWLFSMSRC